MGRTTVVNVFILMIS